MQNPKKAKALLKVALAVASMLAYGAIHKADKMLGEKIDEHYSEPETEENKTED